MFLPRNREFTLEATLPNGREKILITPIQIVDKDDVLSVVNDSRHELEPWLYWVPDLQTESDAKEAIIGNIRAWHNGESAYFGIHHAPRKDAYGNMPSRMPLVGVVSLHSFGQGYRSAKLGYWLKSCETGIGVATKAAQRIIEWGFGELRLHRIGGDAATTNKRSIRCLERLGFQREGTARHAEFIQGRWLDHALYGLLCTDIAKEPVTVAGVERMRGCDTDKTCECQNRVTRPGCDHTPVLHTVIHCVFCGRRYTEEVFDALQPWVKPRKVKS